MSTFVLVHGGWHGAWCWFKLVSRLEAAGHRAVAVDLSGHGKDRLPLADISLRSYVDSVRSALDAVAHDPVVLVGHSMGGGVITQTAEYAAAQIQALVYVSGVIPSNGQTIMNSVDGDRESLLEQAVVVASDGGSMTLRGEYIRPLLYADCTDDDVNLAASLLIPQAIAPTATPLQTTDANFGRIPRIYVECLADRILTPAMQRAIYSRMPCEKVISMNSGHSPFLASPEELATHLISIVA